MQQQILQTGNIRNLYYFKSEIDDDGYNEVI